MRSSVRFLLGTELRDLTNVDPTMTVLQYLRTVERRTGTKEGCAEGDCGACTVVLGQLDGETVRYRAVNACILFLPAIDGMQLLTVEDLREHGGALHPVQTAMVDCHGSQCGFCTPGFVMSLYALYQSDLPARREVVDEALAGNLCRCTGYDVIVAAANQALESREATRAPGPEVLALLRSIRPEGLLDYSFEGRRFLAPASLEDLCLIALKHPSARLLAGGTDVGLWVTKQHRDIDTIIYLGNVPELFQARVTESEIVIGAALPLADAMPLLAPHFPPLDKMLRRFGSPQIRNSGTLGGNIANGSPIGDSMPPLIALGASVVLQRGDSTRELPLDEFFIAYQKTALEPGELVTAVRVPLEPGGLFGVHKVSKRHDQDISTLCGAFRVTLDGETIVSARIAFGGMAAIPARAPQCEEYLVGREWSLETVQSAAALLDEDFTPITDMRGSKEYRRLVAQNLLVKFYLEQAGETVGVFAFGGAQ